MGYTIDMTVRVASIQMDVKIGDVNGNLAKTEALIREAFEKGARVAVLPELCLSGYVFETRAEAFSLSHTIPDCEPVRRWEALAAEFGGYIAAGISEREGSKLFNSSVLVGPEGYIGTYRKLHLWAEECLWYEPGDKGMPVFHTPIGRIGMLICNDQWFPETYRLCALQGADLICVPTNWVWHYDLPDDMRTHGPMLAMTMANCNNVFIAVSDRVGTERGISFPGISLIVDARGLPMARSGGDEETILYADCDFHNARKHQSNPYNSALRDRRGDVYGDLLGYDPGRYL